MVLSAFYTHLVDQAAAEHRLQTMLTLCQERGWRKIRGKQRTDSTHVVAKVRAWNRDGALTLKSLRLPSVFT